MGCFTDDFNIANHGILNQRILKPNILVNAFDIGVDPFDSLSDVIQIVR